MGLDAGLQPRGFATRERYRIVNVNGSLPEVRNLVLQASNRGILAFGSRKPVRTVRTFTTPSRIGDAVVAPGEHALRVAGKITNLIPIPRVYFACREQLPGHPSRMDCVYSSVRRFVVSAVPRLALHALATLGRSHGVPYAAARRARSRPGRTPISSVFASWRTSGSRNHCRIRCPGNRYCRVTREPPRCAHSVYRPTGKRSRYRTK